MYVQNSEVRVCLWSKMTKKGFATLYNSKVNTGSVQTTSTGGRRVSRIQPDRHLGGKDKTDNAMINNYYCPPRRLGALYKSSSESVSYSPV